MRNGDLMLVFGIAVGVGFWPPRRFHRGSDGRETTKAQDGHKEHAQKWHDRHARLRQASHDRRPVWP